MVDIEFKTIDSRVVVRFRREYKSKTLQRSYIANELIIIVQEANLEDIKEDFNTYKLLSDVEQKEFLDRLRLLPHYTGRLLTPSDATVTINNDPGNVMNRTSANEARLLSYGVDSNLAQKAAANLLTLTKIRALAISDITSKFSMSEAEARELKKCVLRKPIDIQIIERLLIASNDVCNVCKGEKGHSFIIHHIDPYERTQDNSYENLILLCPSDHDIAHRDGALTLGLSKDQLIAMKSDWEKQVKTLNVDRATQTINLDTMFKGLVSNSEDERTLRYLMHFTPFTLLASHIHNLPSSFDIDFFDVATYMETLMVDRPHGYPFRDPSLQKNYGEYLATYYDLYRSVIGETNGFAHFLPADDVGGRFISRRNRKNFTYPENENIDQAVTRAKHEFDASYRKLISFLRTNYEDIDLEAYNES
jgi:hypothetical protein